LKKGFAADVPKYLEALHCRAVESPVCNPVAIDDSDQLFLGLIPIRC
jgi:hypothetical protein